MEKAESLNLFAIFSNIFLNGMAWMGAGFIAYGFVVVLTGEQWRPLERLAVSLSSALTIVGTIVTALAIYRFSPSQRQPSKTSIWGTAPAVMIVSLAALWLLWRKSSLPRLW
jgi:surface polysaccharide O-acyltransferase-like enzyme